jgi:hypothetical protein
MRRAVTNRWCAVVLALCLGLASTLAFHGTARAGLYDLANPGDPLGGGGGGAVGDPDQPQGGSRAVVKRGASRATANSGLRVAGDDVGSISVVTMRILVVGQGLRAILFRF